MAITATSEVPSQAALIANLYATAFVQYRQAVAERSLTTAEAQLRSQISLLGQQLSSFRGNTTSPAASALLNQQAVLKEQLAQMQVSGAVDTGEVVLVTPAQTPISPSSPKPVQDALLGLAAGLALGLGAAFLRDSLDDKLASKEAAEQAGGAPVLAMTPVVSSWRRREQQLVVAVTDPTSPAAESYRSLRTSLQFVRQEGQVRSIVVTSPGAAEGKTATLANLGVVFAQAGERVVLVSCDLRRPRIGAFFGLDEEDGLTRVLLGQRTLEQVLVPVPGIKTGSACSRPGRSRRTRPSCSKASAQARSSRACTSGSTSCSSTPRRCCPSPTPRSCHGTQMPRWCSPRRARPGAATCTARWRSWTRSAPRSWASC